MNEQIQELIRELEEYIQEDSEKERVYEEEKNSHMAVYMRGRVHATKIAVERLKLTAWLEDDTNDK